MDSFFDILETLKKEEVRKIRSVLNHSLRKYDKVGKLLDIVTRYPGKSDIFYCEKVYGRSKDPAYRVTKTRLKKIIEESLLTDKSLGQYESAYVNAALLTRKRLLQGEILLGRGAYKASTILLNQVIRTSKQYALHNELLQAKLLLFRHRSANLGIKEITKYSEEIKVLGETTELTNRATILHFALFNKLSTITISNTKELLAVTQDLTELKQIYEQTKSPVAGFYYLRSKLYIEQVTEDFNAAEETGKAYLNLVSKEAAIKSKQRIGSAYLQLAEVSLRSGKIENAEHYSEKSLEMYKPAELNYLIVLETVFRIAFNLGNFKKCTTIIEEAFKNPKFHLSKIREGRWNYFKACLEFQEKSFKSCLKSLNASTSVLNDKVGWNIQFKFLEIMALFESGITELLDTKIENLLQHFKRYKNETEGKERISFLSSLLKDWQKNRFEFKKPGKKLEKMFQSKETIGKEVSFNPSGYEFIRFEEWILKNYNDKN